jgi:hypothetical protein
MWGHVLFVAYKICYLSFVTKDFVLSLVTIRKFFSVTYFTCYLNIISKIIVAQKEIMHKTDHATDHTEFICW